MDRTEAAGLITPGRRRRERAVRVGQYALFALLVGLFVWLADWGALRENFARREFATELFPDILLTGLKNTVVYTLAGFALGFALSLVIALMRLSSVAPYRWFAMTYIEVFRGLPALIIFLFVGFGIPFAFPGFQFPFGVYGKVAFALGLVGAAYMAETIRAGIQAVPRGQMEAARSLGMSHGQAMRSIILPQAFRIIIPPLTNELILLFKDSSLVLFLGTTTQETELTKLGRDAAQLHANATPILVAGLCYLIITIPLGLLVRRLEARAARAL